MSQPIVFFDIAGPDAEALRAFYAAAFDWDCGQPIAFQPGNSQAIGAHIRQDPRETVIYVGVPDVAAALEKIETLGGKTDVPRYEASGVAVLGLFLDPAGNRLGLVEMDGDAPVIP